MAWKNLGAQVEAEFAGLDVFDMWTGEPVYSRVHTGEGSGPRAKLTREEKNRRKAEYLRKWRAKNPRSRKGEYRWDDAAKATKAAWRARRIAEVGIDAFRAQQAAQRREQRAKAA